MNKKSVSPFIVLPFYWMFLSVSRGVRFWKKPLPFYIERAIYENYLVGSPLARSVFILLIVIGLFVLIHRRKIVWPILKSNKMLVLVFILIGFSVLWSSFPFVTFKRFIKTSGTLIMALIVLTEEDQFKATKLLFLLFCSVTLTLSTLFIFVFPSRGTSINWSGTVAWIGLTHQKNGLGQLAVFASIFLIWSLHELKPIKTVIIKLFLLVLSLFLLFGSRSMTSLGMLVIGLFVLIASRVVKPIIRKTKFLLLLSILVVISIIPLFEDLLLKGSILEVLVKAVGKDMTFTGRTALWADVIRAGLRRPILGYGYGVFWLGNLGNDLWAKYVWRPTSAHNGYIDAFIKFGVIGLVILGITIIRAYQNISEVFKRNYIQGVLWFTLLSVILFSNLFETTLLGLNSLYWFLFVLVALSIPENKFNNTPHELIQTVKTGTTQ